MIAHKKVDMEYSLYILIMTTIGTFLGLFFQRYMIEKYKRVSYQNIALVLIFIIAVTATVIVNIPIIVHTSELGQNVFSLTNYCL